MSFAKNQPGEPFPGLSCSSCPGSLAPGDRHLACFRCLGAKHAAAASANPASCAACQALPDEELLSRHIFFSPLVELTEAIDLFKAGVPDLDDVSGPLFVVTCSNITHDNAEKIVSAAGGPVLCINIVYMFADPLSRPGNETRCIPCCVPVNTTQRIHNPGYSGAVIPFSTNWSLTNNTSDRRPCHHSPAQDQLRTLMGTVLYVGSCRI